MVVSMGTPLRVQGPRLWVCRACRVTSARPPALLTALCLTQWRRCLVGKAPSPMPATQQGLSACTSRAWAGPGQGGRKHSFLPPAFQKLGSTQSAPRGGHCGLDWGGRGLGLGESTGTQGPEGKGEGGRVGP